MTRSPFISVIIPCRNEEGYIGTVIRNIQEQDYSSDKMEIIVIDGESDDGTLVEIKELAEGDSRIQILSNPRRIVPTALNLGIKKSRGEIIVRMDAHCEYPSNYISYLVENLQKLNADNVGVAMRAFPRNKSLKAYAISKAISSPFGVGDSHHRTGTTKPVEMDSVPFGCYWRKAFDEIGFFDEELVRNQDDEFNARLGKNGGKIILLPDIEIKYLARDTFRKIARMFYYYGLFKPLVNKKVGSPATIRQFVPPLFLLSLITLVIISIINFQWGLWFGAFTLLPYIFLNLLVSSITAIKSGRAGILFYLFPLFFLIHISYGWGYLRGFVNFIVLNRSNAPKDLATNR
jgi:glycosyltransferase involved in cell wall biosynthesis